MLSEVLLTGSYLQSSRIADRQNTRLQTWQEESNESDFRLNKKTKLAGLLPHIQLSNEIHDRAAPVSAPNSYREKVPRWLLQKGRYALSFS